MAKDPEDKEFEKADGKGVVDGLLTELGVDDEMRTELIESGRMSSDVTVSYTHLRAHET